MDAKKGPGEVEHHVPENAFLKTIGVFHNASPAVLMTQDAHDETRSFAGRGVKSMGDDAGLNARDRMTREIKDLRINHGNNEQTLINGGMHG